MMKYAYYLSCINESLSKEAEYSLNIWTKDLGIELVPLEEGTCCGGSNLDFVNPDQFLAINGRNIALAEKLGLDMITSCNTCLLGLRHAKHILDTQPEKKEMINAVLKEEGLEYTGKSEVKHLLWVLVDDYGLDKLAAKVTNPLTDLKFAPFYGCHILRPSPLMGGYDNPNNPHTLEDLIRALGGNVVEYNSKNKCCGFHTLIVAEQESVKLSGDAVVDAIDAKADYIVTPCPLCHMSLDAYQKDGLSTKNRQGKMPIIHLPQIVGMALGYTEKQLGIDKHVVV
ncbi:MAG: CoB--CoM heterodisulfide reductase iron-sulfur subunit B family protein [Spirochaetia bacterium]|nr:CoB--CoM heterodisulfide reductase iron-sulfur subunit B family protein [Spirochaetia bacterium]